MMKGKGKVILLLSALSISFVLGCNQRAGRSTAKYSPSLMVYSGATDVKYFKYEGTDQLSYRVNVQFPASGVIGWLSFKLEEKGWEPLTHDYLNPHLSSSHVKGWEKFVDATKPNEYIVHQWLADWKDRSENIVRYAFHYRYPKGENPNLKDLEVSAVYTPAPLAKQSLEAARKFKEQLERGQKSK